MQFVWYIVVCDPVKTLHEMTALTVDSVLYSVHTVSIQPIVLEVYIAE